MGMPPSHWQMGNLPVSLHILSAFPPNLSAHAALLLKGLAQTIWPCFSFMNNVSLLEFSHWNYSLKQKTSNFLDPHISNVFPLMQNLLTVINVLYLCFFSSLALL